MPTRRLRPLPADVRVFSITRPRCRAAPEGIRCGLATPTPAPSPGRERPRRARLGEPRLRMGARRQRNIEALRGVLQRVACCRSRRSRCRSARAYLRMGVRRQHNIEALHPAARCVLPPRRSRCRLSRACLHQCASPARIPQGSKIAHICVGACDRRPRSP